MTRFIALFLSLTFLSPAHSSSYANEGNGMDEKLFKLQLGMAEKGDPKNQYFLGEMHEYGLGTAPDLDEAFRWYTKAAEQGNPLAKRKLEHRTEIESKTKNRYEQDAVADKADAKAEKFAAEKEKRRAAVRAMLKERAKNPVGEPFE